MPDQIEPRERKRARFEGHEQAPRPRGAVILAAAVVVIGPAIAVYYLLPKSEQLERRDPQGSASAAAKPTQTPVPRNVLAPKDAEYRIPLAAIGRDASFFAAAAGDKQVAFFVVRDKSGQPHVALDACNTCAKARKGYDQQDDTMRCNNCGMSFPVAEITNKGNEGGCHPIALPARTEGEVLVIDRTEVEAGARWF